MDIKGDLSPAIAKGTDLAASLLNFFGRVFGPAIEAVGGILGNQLRSWQAANLDRLHKKWLKKREESGISEAAIKHLPFNLGTRLLTGASKEDDDTVQELWANLLKTATDPDSKIDVKRVHVELLESITAVEARILEFLWLRLSEKDNSPGIIQSTRISAFAEEKLGAFTLEDRVLALLNLSRLRCIRLAIDDFNLSRLDMAGQIITGRIDPDDIRDAIRTIKTIIEDLSGNSEPFILGLHIEKGKQEGALPEVHYDLTTLGGGLMRACYSNAQ